MKLMSIAMKPAATPPFPLERIEEMTRLMSGDGELKWKARRQLNSGKNCNSSDERAEQKWMDSESALPCLSMRRNHIVGRNKGLFVV